MTLSSSAALRGRLAVRPWSARALLQHSTSGTGALQSRGSARPCTPTPRHTTGRGQPADRYRPPANHYLRISGRYSLTITGLTIV